VEGKYNFSYFQTLALVVDDEWDTFDSVSKLFSQVILELAQTDHLICPILT